ncbi:MAG: glycosyl hydrolase, partial [Anaerolineae bacterium]
MDIIVDCHRDIGPLTHFWRSTGFSPASLLLNADMRQAMAYAGSIPHRGLTYVRVHYLLDLVTAGYPGAETSSYDWSALDKALDVLVQNGLKPFFELMGNPSGHFTDFLDEGQVWAWR